MMLPFSSGWVDTEWPICMYCICVCELYTDYILHIIHDYVVIYNYLSLLKLILLWWKRIALMTCASLKYLPSFQLSSHCSGCESVRQLWKWRLKTIQRKLKLNKGINEKNVPISPSLLDAPESTFCSVITKSAIQLLLRKDCPSKACMQKETYERSHKEPNNHFEAATEFSSWEPNKGALVNHIKSSV